MINRSIIVIMAIIVIIGISGCTSLVKDLPGKDPGKPTPKATPVGDHDSTPSPTTGPSSGNESVEKVIDAYLDWLGYQEVLSGLVNYNMNGYDQYWDTVYNEMGKEKPDYDMLVSEAGSLLKDTDGWNEYLVSLETQRGKFDVARGELKPDSERLRDVITYSGQASRSMDNYYKCMRYARECMVSGGSNLKAYAESIRAGNKNDKYWNDYISDKNDARKQIELANTYLDQSLDAWEGMEGWKK